MKNTKKKQLKANQKFVLIENCQEIKLDDESSQSKTYVIKPENIEMNVYCDFDTDNEGWIVSEKIIKFFTVGKLLTFKTINHYL